MTKRDLINRYLASIGRTRVQGDTAEPLLPFLLGDAIYTLYNRDIAPLDLHREEKQLRSDWARNYTLFNRPFFAAIGIDNQDDIIDLMDEFEEAICPEMDDLRQAFDRLLMDVNRERREPIVSALICHVLAQAAQIAYGNVYRKARILNATPQGNNVMHRPEKNLYLDAINRDAFALANRWHTWVVKDLVDPNKTEEIPPAVTSLCRKMYRWLNDEKNNA